MIEAVWKGKEGEEEAKTCCGREKYKEKEQSRAVCEEKDTSLEEEHNDDE